MSLKSYLKVIVFATIKATKTDNEGNIFNMYS